MLVELYNDWMYFAVLSLWSASPKPEIHGFGLICY